MVEACDKFNSNPQKHQHPMDDLVQMGFHTLAVPGVGLPFACVDIIPSRLHALERFWELPCQLQVRVRNALSFFPMVFRPTRPRSS